MKARKLLGVMMALVLTLALMPTAVFAADTDTVSGTFSLNSNPTLDYIKLYNTATPPSEVTSMIPQVQYDVVVKVSDADGLTDLKGITVGVWYDADAGDPIAAEFENALLNLDAQTSIGIAWEQATGEFTLGEETGSSWDLGSCTAPADLSGEFHFRFTVGKVATETIDPARWQIAASVTDDTDADDLTDNAGWISGGVTMDWYGEIDIAATTVDWGTVNPGMDFGEGDPSEKSVGSIKYISNGAYDEKVKSSATWSGSPSGTATLDADDGSCTNANEFALKADDDDTLNTSVLVDTNGVTLDDTGTITEEAGDTVSTNTLWLKTAATFTKATYTGTITYIIANGT